MCLWWIHSYRSSSKLISFLNRLMTDAKTLQSLLQVCFCFRASWRAPVKAPCFPSPYYPWHLILQPCHTSALCFYPAELGPRQPTERISLKALLKLSHVRTLTSPPSANLSDTLCRCWPWVVAVFYFFLFLFSPPSIWCLVFDCLHRSSAPGLSHCQGSKSPSAQIGWIWRYRQREEHRCHVKSSPFHRERETEADLGEKKALRGSRRWQDFIMSCSFAGLWQSL